MNAEERRRQMRSPPSPHAKRRRTDEPEDEERQTAVLAVQPNARAEPDQDRTERKQRDRGEPRADRKLLLAVFKLLQSPTMSSPSRSIRVERPRTFSARRTASALESSANDGMSPPSTRSWRRISPPPVCTSLTICELLDLLVPCGSSFVQPPTHGTVTGR
jgi:hypothetical protein